MAELKIVLAHLRVASEALTTFKLFIGVAGESSKLALEIICEVAATFNPKQIITFGDIESVKSL